MMKKTHDIEYQLSQLVDGQLPDRQAERLRAQANADPALSEELRRYESLEAHLARQAQALPAVDWQLQREAIRAELEREALLAPAPRRWPGLLLRWSAGVTATAAAIVLLAAGYLQFVTPPPGTGPDVRVTVVGPAQHGEVRVALVAPPAPERVDVDYVRLSPPSAQEAPRATLTREGRRQNLAGMVLVSVGHNGPREADLSFLGEL